MYMCTMSQQSGNEERDATPPPPAATPQAKRKFAGCSTHARALGFGLPPFVVSWDLVQSRSLQGRHPEGAPRGPKSCRTFRTSVRMATTSPGALAVPSAAAAARHHVATGPSQPADISRRVKEWVSAAQQAMLEARCDGHTGARVASPKSDRRSDGWSGV